MCVNLAVYVSGEMCASKSVYASSSSAHAYPKNAPIAIFIVHTTHCQGSDAPCAQLVHLNVCIMLASARNI